MEKTLNYITIGHADRDRKKLWTFLQSITQPTQCSEKKKIVSLNTLAKKNDLSFYLKKLEKEQQIKPKEHRKKAIKSKNQWYRKQTYNREIQQSQSLSLKNMIKSIDLGQQKK